MVIHILVGITNCPYFRILHIRNFLLLIIAQHSSRKHKHLIKKNHSVNIWGIPRFFSAAINVTVIHVFFNKNHDKETFYECRSGVWWRVRMASLWTTDESSIYIYIFSFLHHCDIFTNQRDNLPLFNISCVDFRY